LRETMMATSDSVSSEGIAVNQWK